MSSARMPGGFRLPPARTVVDAQLRERSGLDEVNLRRVRRAFRERWHRTTYAERLALSEGTVCMRYRFVNDLLRAVWSEETWRLWLAYLEHTEADIEEMQNGEYPISPYIIRLVSALLGIKVDFLLMGDGPISDRLGDIDVLSAAGVRA